MRRRDCTCSGQIPPLLMTLLLQSPLDNNSSLMDGHMSEHRMGYNISATVMTMSLKQCGSVVLPGSWSLAFYFSEPQGSDFCFASCGIARCELCMCASIRRSSGSCYGCEPVCNDAHPKTQSRRVYGGAAEWPLTLGFWRRRR